MPRISELPTTSFPNLGHEFPAEREGETHKLTLAQIRALLQYQADEIGLDETNVALALSALDSGKVNVDDLADYVTLSALNAARWPISKLADVNSGTLIGRVDSGLGPPSELSLETARASFSEKPLLFAWSDSDLTGLTQIVENLPSGYSSYEFKISNIHSQSGDGVVAFRCGDPSTGTIYSGASDYVSTYIQRRDTITEIGNETTNRVYAFPFNTNSGAQNIGGTISVGGGDYWNIFLTGGFVHTTGETTVSTRYGRFTSGGDLRRLQIGFNTAIAGIGHIRIWGVR